MPTLVHLRQCLAVSELIVVEMGTAPLAVDLARRWADKYVFAYNPRAFERARALNIGTGLAAYDLVLWPDNDLLVPPPSSARQLLNSARGSWTTSFPIRRYATCRRAIVRR